MKVLKSHRDSYFLKWNTEDYIKGNISQVATFDYVSIKLMQRGDVTQESKQWLKKNHKGAFFNGEFSCQGGFFHVFEKFEKSVYW